MTFVFEDEVIVNYMNYVERMCFGIAKISSKNEDDGKNITLACSRARKYASQSQSPLKSNPITKTQCKARLNTCVCRWNNSSFQCYS